MLSKCTSAFVLTLIFLLSACGGESTSSSSTSSSSSGSHANSSSSNSSSSSSNSSSSSSNSSSNSSSSSSSTSSSSSSSGIPVIKLPLVIAIDSGSENKATLQNEIYEPDCYFQGGQTRAVTSNIANTNEPTLFQSERYGSFSYAIPVTSARYTIKLQLAELYWSKANKRVFSIAIEGAPVISAIDIFTSAGANSALTKIIENIAVTDGILNIDITSEIDNGTLAGIAIYSALGELSSTPTPATVTATNPLIWADVPDPSVLRMGDTYYMSSTTMHMNPGIPIMRSKDLVQWETINYAYETLESGNAMTLSGGQDEYGRGSWASSLVYNAGTYYVSTFSNSANKTYIFKTTSLENGPWERNVINGAYHDSSLFFDNGRLFFVYGSNTIKIIELTPDGKSIKSGGLNQTLIANASSIAGSSLIVPAEGTHAQKINGQYYISLICWPSGGGRTQLLYKSSSLTGPYEGRVVLKNAGIAQGGFIDTADGDWYAFLFQDHGSVGRIPYLVPVKWNNGWPTLGNNGVVP
ncbi:MAG: hypothetical protein EOO68_19095, partial [Moraxellaceae bacterium]